MNDTTTDETYAIVMLGKVPYALFDDFDTATDYVENHPRMDDDKASVFWPVSPMDTETEQ